MTPSSLRNNSGSIPVYVGSRRTSNGRQGVSRMFVVYAGIRSVPDGPTSSRKPFNNS